MKKGNIILLISLVFTHMNSIILSNLAQLPQPKNAIKLLNKNSSLQS